MVGAGAGGVGRTQVTESFVGCGQEFEPCPRGRGDASKDFSARNWAALLFRKISVEIMISYVNNCSVFLASYLALLHAALPKSSF